MDLVDQIDTRSRELLSGLDDVVDEEPHDRWRCVGRGEVLPRGAEHT